MINAAQLLKDDKPHAEAIAAAPADAAAIASALAQASPGPAAAALALLAGQHRVAAAQGTLVALLDDDGLAGRAAAWALGQLDASGDAVLAAIGSGSLDTRQNGYAALAVLAARGKAGPGLAAAMRQRIAAELDRAKQKKTSLAEHALRVLAVLGERDVPALTTTLIDSDPLVDRVELQRLRAAVENDGRDRESIADLTAPWQRQFADDLYQPPAAPAPAPSAAKPGPAHAAPARPPGGRPAGPTGGLMPPGGPRPQRPAAPPPAPAPAPAPAGAYDHEDELPLSDEERAQVEAELNAAAQGAGDGGMASDDGQAKPVDWEAFATSIEAQALPAEQRQMAKQLGSLLEQLCARAVGVMIYDLRGQELAALLLQVMPQAVPPQMVQAALSPQGLNAMQAVTRHLTSTYSASADLVDGIKLVRKTLQAQMRRQGMLGGPDYSDPDDKPAPPPIG